jgi:diguanylate cyclase (GGDEF)-like protein
MSTPTPTKQNLYTDDNLLSQAQEPSSAIQDWRINVLNVLLPIVTIALFPALIQTLAQALEDPQIAWQGVAILFVFYLVLVYVTLRRSLDPTARGQVLIALTYMTGVVALARGGLVGDGRLYLIVLPILATTLINAQVGIYAAGLSIFTYAIFGYLAHTGVLSQWLIIHDNSQDGAYWFYNGLTMGALTLMTIYLVVKFFNFQIQTLKSVQEIAQALANANQQLEQKIQERTAELTNANQHLQFLATHDNLTGLPNRFLFFDRLDQAIRKGRRQKHKFALLFIDLDDFKDVNDSYGHVTGDEVLQKVAEFLEYTVRDSDTVARLAGDEFTIILDNVGSVANVEAIVKKIVNAISQPIEAKQASIVMTASIGISLFPDHGEDAEILLRKADTAMYRIKAGDKNSYRFYSDEES